MSAETLRRAAALMRERAEGATQGTWHVRHRHYITVDAHPPVVIGCDEAADATHVASWRPAVAFTVAAPESERMKHALAIANAYLGETPC